MKNFTDWNKLKMKVEHFHTPYYFEREIYYAKIGENVGFEQCGKGDLFERPVLIFRKFSKQTFWGIPLSTTTRRGKYYFPFKFIDEKESVAILSQLKFIDSRRLDRKIGKMSIEDHKKLKKAIKQLVDPDDSPMNVSEDSEESSAVPTKENDL